MPAPLLQALLAALIQLQGQPLAGGRSQGGASLPLERATGGDTPVLTFETPRGRLRLLLDTGAASAMVTPQLAERLGLVSMPLPPSAFGLAGGGSDCASLRPSRAVLPPLSLRGDRPGETLRLQGLEALLLPVTALPPGVDGVIGAPSLRQLPIWIDPIAGRLALGPSALRQAALAAAVATAPTLSRQHDAPTTAAGWSPTQSSGATAQPAAGAALDGSPLAPPPQTRLPLRWQQGVPLLRLRTPSGVVSALADSGAEGLFLAPALAARLPQQGTARILRLVGICGEQPVLQTRIAGLALADGDHGTAAVQEAQPLHAVLITTNPIFRALGVEAIVGQELLRQRRQLWRLDQNPPWLELR